jgi:CheY-like chemotaxis protein
MARVLIVEDSPDSMKLFKAVLELRGHEVTGIQDGEHLKDAVEGANPDIILMDIQLPGFDGYELLRSLHSSSGWHIPVVALTAHAMVGDQRRALEAGFEAYITKPIDIMRFPEQVEGVLSRGDGPRIANEGS